MSDEARLNGENFLLTSLKAEYDVYAWLQQQMGQTFTFYLAGISILITVFVTVLKGFWDTQPIDFYVASVITSILAAIGVALGSVTFLRIVNQRKSSVNSIKKIRALERYFIDVHPEIGKYVLEHTPHRLKQDYIANAFFSPAALIALRIFAVWNAILIGMSSTLAVQTILNQVLNFSTNDWLISLGFGLAIIVLWLSWSLKLLKTARAGAVSVLREEYNFVFETTSRQTPTRHDTQPTRATTKAKRKS